MLREEINEFERDIQEAFREVADTENIAFKLYKDTAPNIYGESKVKDYGSPIILPSRARINPNGDELSELAKREGANAIFTFITADIREAGLEDEKGVKISDKDIIVFRGTVYKILKVVPSAMLKDKFLLHKFECKEDN